MVAKTLFGIVGRAGGWMFYNDGKMAWFDDMRIAHITASSFNDTRSGGPYTVVEIGLDAKPVKRKGNK